MDGIAQGEPCTAKILGRCRGAILLFVPTMGNAVE
jgi:hypothetical protein